VSSDLLQPADEVAEEAGYTEGEEDPVVTSVEIQHVRGVYFLFKLVVPGTCMSSIL